MYLKSKKITQYNKTTKTITNKKIPPKTPKIKKK